ncbi:adenylate kinase [Helicobacter didelphidarum]|uniref:Adenylate kinase n=1 Tax=Helicobacter didelphidarum TaxID=2040648 RepID=A0A3D8ISH4_9HELI|nr:adenylate kinase [Helicobacter didelphidarum]RDU67574.1 adenylate kinase [Helicobacter didelphidarum]
MKKLFLIIGAPGSGKTTDAQKIAAANNAIAHYSTGDLLRAEVASGSSQGKTIESFTSKGNLVPLDIVVQTIVGAINNSPKDIILIDGYPRSVEQMMELDKVLAQDFNVKLVSVIEVKVSEEVARDRVLGRARGADDNAEVFKNRMRVYLDPLNDIQKFYNNANILKVIDGERTIDEIVSEMKIYIESQC